MARVFGAGAGGKIVTGFALFGYIEHRQGDAL
jgi:hypothetical protein